MKLVLEKKKTKCDNNNVNNNNNNQKKLIVQDNLPEQSKWHQYIKLTKHASMKPETFLW